MRQTYRLASLGEIQRAFAVAGYAPITVEHAIFVQLIIHRHYR